MKKNIITVSRQFGSGGRTIGRTVAQRLGIPCYDKELVDKVALESGFDPKFVEERGEASPGKSRFSFSFLGHGVPGVMGGMSANDFLWTIQYNVILSLAEKGPCVIVGRCADYALAGRPGLLRIFCRADLTQRFKRIQQRHNLSLEKAALLVAKTDRHRRVYYHHHTGKFWGHSSCYDLTVNTSVLGVEKTAEALEAYIRAFQEQD